MRSKHKVKKKHTDVPNEFLHPKYVNATEALRLFSKFCEATHPNFLSPFLAELLFDTFLNFFFKSGAGSSLKLQRNINNSPVPSSVFHSVHPYVCFTAKSC